LPHCPSSTLLFCLVRLPKDRIPCPSSWVPFESSGSPVPMTLAAESGYEHCSPSRPELPVCSHYIRVSELPFLARLALQHFYVLSHRSVRALSSFLVPRYRLLTQRTAISSGRKNPWKHALTPGASLYHHPTSAGGPKTRRRSPNEG